MLGYAWAGHGPSKRKIVSVEAVIQAVRTTLASLLQEVEGQMFGGPLPMVEADRIQVEQLFQNLIGNALKYRRPDVAPAITIIGAEIPGG